MRNIISLLLLVLVSACAEDKSFKITVSNPSDFDRKNEIIELESDFLEAFEKDSFIITDPMGMQVTYQITHDNKLIFPATVKANENAIYTIQTGSPEVFKPLACGKQYPERVDDMAWENDRIAFRTYGPALQASGERAFGYDVWVKCVSSPVVDIRYKTELNPETKEQIAKLRKKDGNAAQQLANSISYHIDHGNGLDCYKVGPTLGDGTSALLNPDSSIVYPYCYKDYEILDNGPLRFTVKLTYNPLTVGDNSNVVETRTILLDAGSQLNKCTVSYANLTSATPVATGLVMHAPSEDFQADCEKGYITYAEADDSQNGRIFVGAVFPEKPNETKVVKFTAEEKAERGAEGHVMAYSTYTPGKPYVYYTGAGWSKFGFKQPEDWVNYIQQFSERLKQPLTVTVE